MSFKYIWLVSSLAILISATPLEHEKEKADNRTSSITPIYQVSVVPITNPSDNSTTTEHATSTSEATLNNSTSTTLATNITTASSETGNKTTENSTSTTSGVEKTPEANITTTKSSEIVGNTTIHVEGTTQIPNASNSTENSTSNATSSKGCTCCCPSKGCATFTIQDLRSHLGVSGRHHFFAEENNKHHHNVKSHHEEHEKQNTFLEQPEKNQREWNPQHFLQIQKEHLKEIYKHVNPYEKKQEKHEKNKNH